MRAWFLVLAVGLLAACSKGEGGSAGAAGAVSSASPAAVSAAWPAVSIPPLSEDRSLDAARRRGEYKALADRRVRLADGRIEAVEQLVKASKLPATRLGPIREARQRLDLAFHHVEGATDAAWAAASAEFEEADQSLGRLLDGALSPPGR
jgi:hypothetical protein